MVHARMVEKTDSNYPWIKLINGVELFFVLSGFLIGGILLRTFERQAAFDFRTIFHFWIRRWFRTLPCYYLILLLYIGLELLSEKQALLPYISWRYFFFLQNFHEPFMGFFTESWSLSIEEWFYLLFPIFLYGIHQLLKPFHFRKDQVFLSAVFLFFAASLIMRIIKSLNSNVDGFWLEIGIYRVVIYRLDTLALGIIAAYLHRYFNETWNNWSNILFIIGIILSYWLIYQNREPNSFFSKAIYPSLQSIGCALLLPKFSNIRQAPPYVVAFFTHLSLISYSMYLLNMQVANRLTRFFPPENDSEAWLLYLVYWLLTIAFSTLLYKYFEKPAMQLRDKVFSVHKA